jgi:hypothetical protein
MIQNHIFSEIQNFKKNRFKMFLGQVKGWGGGEAKKKKKKGKNHKICICGFHCVYKHIEG